MKTNLELLKEAIEQLNEECGYNPLTGFRFIEGITDEETLGIFFDSELILLSTEELVEDSEDIVLNFITDFYEYNSRTRARKEHMRLEKRLKGLIRKMLKLDDDEKILEIVENMKEIKSEMDDFKVDIKWTKNVAKNLYNLRDIYFLID